MRGAKAVAIQINSPGGSAVQSMLIYKRIRALAAEKNLKVYVFAEDVAASGGYLLALAGDEIYADPSSIVGSIGVITATFGVNELINRIGVERRVYTAGESKDTLDPFLPEKPEDVERIKALQRDVHQAFIDLVKTRRGAKIDKAGVDLFTGEFWSGGKALELGLIDGLSDLRTKMREIYGDEVRLKLVCVLHVLVPPLARRFCRRRWLRVSVSHPAGLPPISSRRSKPARFGRVSGSERCRRSSSLPPWAPALLLAGRFYREMQSASNPSSEPPRRRWSGARGRTRCRSNGTRQPGSTGRSGWRKGPKARGISAKPAVSHRIEIRGSAMRPA